MAGGGKGGDQIAGYKYFMGLQMGMGRGPWNALTQINVGDKVAWKGEATTNQTISIRKPNLFGGDKKEGGIVGSFELMLGGATQTIGTLLAKMLSKGKDLPLPQFRGTTTGFFDGQICSNNPYPKDWKFRGWRTTAGWHDDAPWYPERATVFMPDDEDPTQIIKAMNPAHIIYQASTDPGWGGGFSPDMIAEDSFIVAANQFYDEGMGLCAKWERTGTVESFIQSVVDHAGCALYVDRRTGLYTIKLIRNDYDPDDLPVFTPNSGLLSIEDDDSGAGDSLVNEIVVQYIHVASGQERSTREQNLASAQSAGSALSLSMLFPHCPTARLASRIARRELKVRSSPFKRFKIRLDRRGSGLTPGMVFKIEVPSRGIGTMILRAAEVEEPGPVPQEFVVTCGQDVFGLPSTAFSLPGVSPHDPPTIAPEAPLNVYLAEVDYRGLVRFLSDADRATVQPDDATAYTVVRRPSDVVQDYELWTKAEGEQFYFRRAVGSFSPFAVLANGIGPHDTQIPFAENDDLDSPLWPFSAMLGREIVRVDSVDFTTNTLTVARGCLDTIPVGHAAGAVLICQDGYQTLDPRRYVETDEIHARVLTRTLSATYPFDTAADYPIVLRARHFKPYPPGDVRVNTAPFGTVSNVFGLDVALTWEGRNRVIQGDTLIGHEAITVTEEVGTTYNVRVYSGTTLLRESLGITGHSFDYTQADWAADGSVVVVTFELESERDAVVSWQRYRIILRFDDPAAVATASSLTQSAPPWWRRRMLRRTP